MTMIQLKYFLAICDSGKIRTTAEQVHVSEPAISVSIKRLEDEVGAPLFTRIKKRLVLTEEGRYLREKAIPVVAGFDRLEAEMEQRRQRQPKVLRLGIPSSLSEYIFPPLFSAFLEKVPGVLFEFVPGSSKDLAGKVAEDQLELAICDKSAAESELMEFIPLRHSVLMGCVCPEHPLAGREHVSPQELAGEKILCLHENSTFTKELKKWFQRGDVEPEIFMYSNRIAFTISMMKRHNAVTFFLDDIIEANHSIRQENLCQFTLAPPIGFVNGIVRKRSRRLSWEAQRFFRFCSDMRSGTESGGMDLLPNA